MTREEFISNVRYIGWICFQMGSGLPLHDVPGDFSMSDERLNSLIEGTVWALNNPEATAEDNHINWMKCKEKQGYVYGEKIDTVKKTHPSMVKFEELSETEQRKDEMDLLVTKLADRLFSYTYK